MTYISSRQTFIFKYIFPAVMLVGGILAFITLKNSGDELTSNFANAFGIALIGISIFLIQMPFRVKYVEVDENGLKSKSGSGNEIIPFKNVKSVSKLDLSNPWMITVKYLDSRRNENRKISYMPNSEYQRIMKEDEMTEYISNQARLKNPNFEESSILRNLLILLLAGLPFYIGIIYFISKTGINNY